MITHPLSKFASCVVCARLYRVWLSGFSEAARDEYTTHVVTEHANLVPGYKSGCTRCTDFRVMLEQPKSIVSSPVRAMLTKLSAEHRIGAHLLEQNGLAA